MENTTLFEGVSMVSKRFLMAFKDVQGYSIAF